MTIEERRARVLRATTTDPIIQRFLNLSTPHSGAEEDDNGNDNDEHNNEVDAHGNTTLFCIIVGVGVVFSVNIGLNKTAGDLKHEIKAKKPNHVQFDASLLKLYLASRGDTWLKSRDKNSMLALKKEILQMKYTI
uniref:Crinkler effector protein N-terminal domain-containing protein n=1 Tax=Globisporangium ultimum (strain ATCC 200006 / CBS 805.95 / DAOM BR144) TaxID=431595 RepID=K3WB59_GLOUD